MANPLESRHTFSIAGITVYVYGLDELSGNIINTTCLWLLHPRLNTHACMEPLARTIIDAWNQRLGSVKADSTKAAGLIAVSFDQRNHGSREVDKLANEAWRNGNPRHAQDMFSIYNGTALDTSLLIAYLSSYIFPLGEHKISTNFVLGVSLGGHAAWQCLLHESQVSAAVIIIGCPDYKRMMADRARLSKRDTWTKTSPPGSSFFGSEDFPSGLTETVSRWDPAAVLMEGNAEANVPSLEQRKSMEKHLKGKRILNLSGSADKLVPYRCSEPFLDWLKKAIGPNGWFEGEGVFLQDILFDGIGHEMTPQMIDEAVRFLLQTLED